MTWTLDRQFDQFLRHPEARPRLAGGANGLYDFIARCPRLIADWKSRYRRRPFQGDQAMSSAERRLVGDRDAEL